MEFVLSFFGLPHNFGQKVDNTFVRAFLHVKDHFIPHHRNNYHPHMLGHRSLAMFSFLLVAVKIFTLGALTFGPVESAFSSAITESNIISLTNASRASFGLTALTQNSKLTEAAQAKANDMLAKGYFSHNTPDGKTPWDFVVSANYNYLTAGENLAVNFSEAEEVEDAWMNSPGHKANILNKSFEEIGVGISQGLYQGKNAVFVVQMFGTEAAQKVVLNDAPTPVAPPSTVEKVVEAKPVETKIDAKAESPVKASPIVTMEKSAETAVSQIEEKTKVEPLPEKLAIAETNFDKRGELLNLTAEILGNPVKVLARFGNSAVLMQARSDGSWAGEIKLSQLTEQGAGLVLEAYDIRGNKINSQVAGFAGSTQSNFNVVPSEKSEEKKVSLFGTTFSPKNFEQKFYLISIALLLSCLILAIGIKRHVQHLSLIANTSFVIVLTLGFWLK